METIPILKMGDLLLVSIQVDMHDRLAMSLQADLTERVVKFHTRGVMIDISALDVVDSFIAVVGMRPAVAITLVEFGMPMAQVHTALNVEVGMELLRSLTKGITEGAHRENHAD
jgi:rsbT antagonist protein RsbS